MISALVSLVWRHVDRRGQTIQKEKSSTQIVERETMSQSEEAECITQSDMDKDETRLVQWPPQKLKNGLLKPSSILTSLLSFLIVATNATYIGILLRHDGRDVEDLGSLWIFVGQFSHLGPTVVPLMFAFVVGRAVRSYAHWRLQQGERIGTLDSLFGSTTLTGTITTILDLKSMRGMEGFLLFLWSLSPLGGQAALRVLAPANENNSSLVRLPYLDHDVDIPSRYSEDLLQDQNVPINTLVLGSIGASDAVNISKVDTCGNIKIPMIEFFSHHHDLESNDWIYLDQHQGEVVFSALLGIPIAKIPRTHNSSFALETSYLRLNCTDLRSIAERDFRAPDFKTYEGCEKEHWCSHRFKWGEIGTIPNIQRVQNSTMDGERCTDPQVSARDLIYWNFGGVASEFNYTVAKCSMATSFVAVNVSCLGWDCGVAAIRSSTLASQGGQISNKTFFDGCAQRNSTWQTFFNYFDSLAGANDPDQSLTIIQSYLVDPRSALNATAVWGLRPVHAVTKELFSVRLSQLLNTYWLAMIGTEPLFLGHPENYDGLSKWNVGLPDDPSNNCKFLETEATVYFGFKALRYQRAWMAVLIVATLVLLLTTVLDFALGLKIWVPKLLMNISTLTRGNPNFDVPAGGGALSDEARAKVLANVKVRFGDAEGVDESSDLVIGNCVEHGGRVSKLTKGKLYT